jgi:hypothetical protein
MVRIDNSTAKYLAEKAKLTHKKPEEIIGSLVREQIALQTTT